MGLPQHTGLAFVFPGQASQRAGMAAALLEHEPAARPVFDKASEVLGLDLAGLCTNGSEALLTQTDIAQPALLTTCVAWLAVLRAGGLHPQMLAGHSLGEFSAWVASEALDFEAALLLVRHRAQLMADAAHRNPGGMLAIIGLPEDQVHDICKQAASAGIIAAANYNSPEQIVLSGQLPALEKAAPLAKAGGGRAIPLRVSGPFHSPLMAEAADEFSRLVAALPIADPKTPVIANATAEPVLAAGGVREVMSRQMTSPVLWAASVRRMVADGARRFIEVGPGQVLTKLVQRINADVDASSAESLARAPFPSQSEGS